jgi:hypothetical protein
MAQERKEFEFKISVGDTIVWTPFNDCDTINYSIKFPNNIDIKPLKYGNSVQVIAKRVGNSRITTKCGADVFVAEFIIFDPNDIPDGPVIPVKPATQAFTDTYKYTPPTDNYFITIHNQTGDFYETYMKHGDEEAFNDGVGFDRFWNVKTGKVWYYCPDAQGWTDDVDWEFEPLDGSCPPLNSFANEVDKSNLSNYYVGKERVLDINCWKFFVEQEDGSVNQYWVDPANGCTLKRQFNSEPAKVVTVYDLNYNRVHFGPSFKKGLHDTRR